jgi:hypothetical protein
MLLVEESVDTKDHQLVLYRYQVFRKNSNLVFVDVKPLIKNISSKFSISKLALSQDFVAIQTNKKDDKKDIRILTLRDLNQLHIFQSTKELAS